MIHLGSAANRLFVVAAHADDDTIGCGGTMAMVAANGGAVSVAYLTDGSRSHPESKRFSPADVARIREVEAFDALGELGITSVPEFFRLPDSALGAIAGEALVRVVERLAALIRAFEPDFVVAPWDRDPHADHIAAAAISRRAFGESRSHASYAGYDVWLSIRGEADDQPEPGEATVMKVILTDRAREAKRRALFSHRSQTTDLIDDAAGFRITSDLAERWLGPTERFFF